MDAQNQKVKRERKVLGEEKLRNIQNRRQLAESQFLIFKKRKLS